MPERLDRVQVTRNGVAVGEISSAGRAVIFEQLRRSHERSQGEARSWPALRAFEEAGTSGRIKLDRAGGAAVMDAIRNLAESAGGVHHLGAGVAELQNRLVKESRKEWAAEERGNTAARIVLLVGLLRVVGFVSSRIRRM